MYEPVCCVCEDVCKPHNITEHEQAMHDAVTAAMLQQANKEVTLEPDSAASSSDDQQLTDDEPSLETGEPSKEDL